MRKRVISVVPREVVDSLHDTSTYDNQLPVMFHPAFRLDTLSPRLFKDIVNRHQTVNDIPSLDNHYILELSLPGSLYPKPDMTGSIRKLSLKEVNCIYRIETLNEEYFALEPVYGKRSKNILYPKGIIINSYNYKYNKLPLPDMSLLPSVDMWYDYNCVVNAYISSILYAYGSDLTIDHIKSELTKDELTLNKLYERTCKLIKPNSYPRECSREFILMCKNKNDLADDKVLSFIADMRFNRVRSVDVSDNINCIRELFIKDFSYYFALMLSEAFDRGRIMLYENENRFVWLDDSGLVYDIDGISAILIDDLSVVPNNTESMKIYKRLLKE